jgi:uncharacterized protein YxeA
MSKNLIVILFLLLTACTSNSNKNKRNQDSLNQLKDIQTQTTSKKEKVDVDSNFLSYWQKFVDIVSSSNYRQFKKVSFNALKCEDTNVYVDEFIKSYFAKVFDDSVLLKMTNTGAVEFTDDAIEPAYISSSIKRQIKNADYVITIEEVNITNGKYPDIIITTLKFINTNNGYKFYGYDIFGG